MWPLQDQEDTVTVATGWTLDVKVGGDRGEEPRGDRDQPLVTTLALGDEHPSLSDPEVLQSQTEHLTPAQTAELHRGDHRPVPVGPQHGDERVDLGRGQEPEQASGPPGQRHPCPGRERSRRVGQIR